MVNVLAENLTPSAIVTELNRYIIGQERAKRAVAIALRNRWRRQQLPEDLQQEVLPKNILMIGPTGVGKTEIARRLAKLVRAPFLKVEATKFTEVGYVGRDVEQIVRDLVEVAIRLLEDQRRDEVWDKAQAHAEEKLLDALVGKSASENTRAQHRTELREGRLDNKEVEVELQDRSANKMPTFDLPGMGGGQVGAINLSDLLGKGMGGSTRKQKLQVQDAFRALIEEEAEELIDHDQLVKDAIRHTEDNGIVFLDEIDKVCSSANRGDSNVSREGVQRDLLPLLEGCAVQTKHGTVHTDHILFVASGAFHAAKPSELLPELQGRLPNRVEMAALEENDLYRILTEPEANLLRQYTAMLEAEGVHLHFADDAIRDIASKASIVNSRVENIGARRLQTLMEQLLEDISFNADQHAGDTHTVDKAYVENALSEHISAEDVSRFIL